MNINGMEVFVVGIDKKTKMTWSFMTVTHRFIGTNKENNALFKKYKSLEIHEVDYQAAGTDQIMLRFGNLEEVIAVLSKESEIVTSIKEMNLRLMRKGGTRFYPYHCFDLVQDVM